MLECDFYSPQWADLLQWRFSLNRLDSCQTLAEVTTICNRNHRYEGENMPHNFSISKYLNVIYKLLEHFCWKCLSAVITSSGVDVWPCWNSSEKFTPALAKHGGLFAKTRQRKVTYILIELAANCTAFQCCELDSANQSFSFHIVCNCDYSSWKN